MVCLSVCVLILKKEDFEMLCVLSVLFVLWMM